jgi:hypothetical protein
MVMIDSGHEKKPLGIFLVTRVALLGAWQTAGKAANGNTAGPLISDAPGTASGDAGRVLAGRRVADR